MGGIGGPQGGKRFVPIREIDLMPQDVERPGVGDDVVCPEQDRRNAPLFLTPGVKVMHRDERAVDEVELLAVDLLGQ